ncbi:DoxX family protein [bacterium]|jgi:putative oxidoreductase|nr:DoxX family protein [bacterium]
MKKLYGKFVDMVSDCGDKIGLLTRVCVGFIFAHSGWAKLHSLDKVTEFFVSLGIPLASIQAPFVSVVELLGGLCLIFGVVTRLASIPLIATMIVAILTAKRGDISELSDLLGMSEFLFILLLLWLVASGPGRYSIDQRLFKKK